MIVLIQELGIVFQELVAACFGLIQTIMQFVIYIPPALALAVPMIMATNYVLYKFENYCEQRYINNGYKRTWI